MIKKFMTEVFWDFYWSGTSDEHLAVMENVKSPNFIDYSAIVGTTPQNVAVNDVKREIKICKKLEYQSLDLLKTIIWLISI